MRSLRAFFVRALGLFHRGRSERDFATELEGHLQLHIEDNLRTGMSPYEARRDALLKLGGIQRTKEGYRDRSGLPALQTLTQDVRYGLRQIQHNRAFTIAAVLTLALGIGANTAIFSVVNAVVLRPLPYPQPDQLVVTSLINPQSPSAGFAYGMADYIAAHDRQRSFTNFAGASWADSFTYTGGAEPLRVRGARVTAEFFSVLDVSPALGRVFAPGDDRPGHIREVVLSYPFWRQHFGADPQIVGRALALDGESYIVIGVMPAEFHFGAFGASDNLDLWPLLQLATRNARYPFWLRTIGRLRSGVTGTQARLELSAIARDVQRQFPDSDFSAASIEPLKTEVIGKVRTPLLILLGAVGLVLSIATVNVANLEIARATARGRELAIRAALGASRGRIARQVLTESALVAALGGAVGLFLAYWCVRGILILAPAGIPRLAEIAVDRQVLAFTAAVSLLCGLLFGLAPAAHGFGRDIEEALRGGGQNLREQREGRGLRSALVVMEVSLSLVLLIGAGLLMRSFERLTNTSPGFNPKPLMSALISLPQARYPSENQIVSFYSQLLDRVRNLPGVASAGISMSLPPDLTNMWNPFWVPSEPLARGRSLPLAVETSVSPGYFRTLGVALLRGRWFEDSDRARSDQILIVNDAMARRYFAGQDPIGRTIKTGDPSRNSPWETIVGVVADVKYAGLDSPPQPTLYVPYFQTYWPIFSRQMFLVARSSGDPKAIASSLQTAVQGLDRDVPLSDLHTMNELLSGSVAQPRFRTLLLGLFAGLALLLSAIGIYGVMAYLVNRRTQEIGVRMALGASRAQVLRMILEEGLGVALIGIGIGLVEAFASTRLLKGLLFGVQPADPATYAGVSVTVIAVALVACYIPARQAMRVDPMIALRHE
jgi:putative ABC transport system permease protein